MREGMGRHAALAVELTEWWEDLWQRHTGSRVVLAKVPAGWGRTTVLDRFGAEIAAREDAPVTLTVRVNGQDLPSEISLQAQALRDLLTHAVEQRPRATELLGLDRAGGMAQFGLSVSGLFFPGLAAGISFLLAGLAAGAVGKAWDDSPAGQDGALARAARAIAAVSVHVPVVVILDDADSLDHDLAVTVVENLAARHHGQVLIIAAVDPGSSLAAALTARTWQGLTAGLVHAAEADPDMGYESRLDLTRQVAPGLPAPAVRRIAQRTATFAEVFTIVSAPRLAELTWQDDQAEVLTVADTVISARLQRPVPSAEAVAIAWAGGLVHTQQAARVLDVLNVTRAGDSDLDVRRSGQLVRLTDPRSPRLAGQVTALATGDRRAMAAVLLEEALAIATGQHAGPVDRAAALLAAHRIRGDLTSHARLPQAQRELIATLEALGDRAAALDVAVTALTEWPPGAGVTDDWDALAGAVLRLSRIAPQAPSGPLEQRLIADAVAGGAVTGLEARVWAAADLLDEPGQREAALILTGRIVADLDGSFDSGETADRWRLLLGYHTARAGHPGIAGQLLAPLLASHDPDRHRAARAILDVGDGPRADIRLQNILLAAELAVLPAEADDDRLRIHHALAGNLATLGDYHQALTHGQEELDLRTHIQGADHPGTLTIRANIADWTGRRGEPAAALALFLELLPHMERVLGSNHHDTLVIRAHIALWTGQSGNPRGALAQYQDLLPDQERVLGPSHPDTLAGRAGIALSAGQSGDPRAALACCLDLLPDQERVLGPEHFDTLTTRGNIAHWIGVCGDSAAALAKLRDLLPDRERVLGRDHPDTLGTRSNIAHQTGRSGDDAGALAIYLDLLPDQVRILGPDHPHTLSTRGNIAYLTGQCGDPAAALVATRKLLPSVERVLGRYHPETLAARALIAYWTARCGDPCEALTMYRQVLLDQETTLGVHHPSTLATRTNIAFLTEGNAALTES